MSVRTIKLLSAAEIAEVRAEVQRREEHIRGGIPTRPMDAGRSESALYWTDSSVTSNSNPQSRGSRRRAAKRCHGD